MTTVSTFLNYKVISYRRTIIIDVLLVIGRTISNGQITGSREFN